MLFFASITPHPPIIIPTIGSKEDLLKVGKTTLAMKKLKEEIENKKPDTLIIISPHGPVNFEELSIAESENFTGDFSMFGDSKTQLSFSNDNEIQKEIIESCQKENIAYRTYRKENLDHGTLVPLFFLTKNIKPKIVPLAYSMLEASVNFEYGKIIGKVVKRTSKKIGIIASGDLSHRLTPQASAGYSKKGKEFDEKLIGFLKTNNVKNILNIDENLAEEACECGYRSIAILLGALSVLKNKNLKFNILSYEGPFGVGYLVANIEGITGS